MAKTIPVAMQSEIVKETARPIFFIEIGFSTLLRLSSRGNQTIEGDDFAAATLDVNLSSKRFGIFNERLQFVQFVQEKAPGRSVKIWQGYGEGPFVYSDLILQHSGVIGPGQIGTLISFSLQRGAPRKTPHLTIGPPVLNHIPPDGTIVETSNGTIKISGNG